jgi:hypothetical protein
MEITLILSEVVTQSPRFSRCKDLFEDFCVVSASIRQGIPMRVRLQDEAGTLLHSTE